MISGPESLFFALKIKAFRAPLPEAEIEGGLATSGGTAARAGRERQLAA